MNLEKSLEYFNPINDVKAPIHIIGVGAIGSTLAEQLARLGCTDINLYDFDIVEEKNIANQNFYRGHLEMNKALAVAQMLNAINPTINGIVHTDGYTNQMLNGYVFLCVDSIDLRRQIATENQYNQQIKAMFDFRMRLTDAQHYATKWNEPKRVSNFIKSMNFTTEEAKEATPINACGGALNVRYTVSAIVSFGVANFVSLIKTDTLSNIILVNMEHMDVQKI